jgi:uncharacterized membrane protein
VTAVAVLLALGSSALWGSSDFYGGLLSRRRPVLAVTWVSQIIALLAVALMATVMGSWERPHSYLWWGVAAGALGSLGIVAFYRALAIGPMGLVAAIGATSVVLPVLAGLVGGDRPVPIEYAGMALAIVGVVLASGPEFRSEERLRTSTIGLALLAAFGFGSYFWAIAHVADRNLPMILITQRSTNLVIGAVLLMGTATAVHFTRADLPMLIFVGLGDVSANATFALATRHGSLAVVSVLASLYPMVTALMARVLLGERLRRVQQVGAATAMTGAVLLAA